MPVYKDNKGFLYYAKKENPLINPTIKSQVDKATSPVAPKVDTIATTPKVEPVSTEPKKPVFNFQKKKV